jgi:type I restriction enzyme M protein
MARLESDIYDAIDQVLNALASRVVLIAKRYEHTLGEIEEKTAKSKAKVKSALGRMGYTW